FDTDLAKCSFIAVRTPVFVSIERLARIAADEFMEESFRESGEGVRLVVVQPLYIVTSTCIPGDLPLPEVVRKTEFVAFSSRNLRRIEVDEIIRFQHIAFEQDDDCSPTP